MRLIESFLAAQYESEAAVPEVDAGLKACEACVRDLEALSKSGPAGLERLKTADAGSLLRSDGRRLMSQLRSLVNVIDASVLPPVLEDALHKRSAP